MMKTCLRHACLTLALGLLLSCGGGGGGGFPIVAGGASGPSGPAGAINTSSGQSLLDRTIAPAGGSSPGDSGSGSSNGGGTSVAGGDDGSGVGSGGTGVTTADATGIGSVDGAGSILVNGVRYNTDGAVVSLDDVPGLQLGMTAKVTGPFDIDLTSGSAKRVDSAVDLRGPVSSLDAPGGSFTILGTTVTTDAATVWADSRGIGDVPPGATLQVWGLPSSPGSLRATRVEMHASGTPIVSGMVQNLDTAAGRFSIGAYAIDYGQASVTGGSSAMPFANGMLVRVRANAVGSGLLIASAVQQWYPVPSVDGTSLQIAGVVTDFAGLGSLRVLDMPVDASTAKVSGGPAQSIGNGVKVIVGGVLSSNGVLQASRLKIQLLPGTGGQPSFNLTGIISTFNSIADFRIKGQPIDASGPDVRFTNGSAANLGAQIRVNVEGSRVVDGVLIADRVTFQ